MVAELFYKKENHPQDRVRGWFYRAVTTYPWLPPKSCKCSHSLSTSSWSV